MRYLHRLLRMMEEQRKLYQVERGISYQGWKVIWTNTDGSRGESAIHESEWEAHDTHDNLAFASCMSEIECEGLACLEEPGDFLARKDPGIVAELIQEMNETYGNRKGKGNG